MADYFRWVSRPLLTVSTSSKGVSPPFIRLFFRRWTKVPTWELQSRDLRHDLSWIPFWKPGYLWKALSEETQCQAAGQKHLLREFIDETRCIDKYHITNRHYFVGRLVEYQVIGRHLPTENLPTPKLYRMRIFAPNTVVAKSRFWYFLMKLRKVKKSNGEMLCLILVWCHLILSPSLSVPAYESNAEVNITNLDPWKTTPKSEELWYLD